MAKINFNKLDCKINANVIELDWNSQTIEVAQYLPIQEKLGIMESVIESSMTQYNYANPVQVEVYTYLNLVKYYTNIKFTDKKWEEPAKLYDTLKSSGLLKAICDHIPSEELNELLSGTTKSIEAFYSYRTSILGILDVLKDDYSNINDGMSAVLEQVKDPEALHLVKELLPFMRAEGVN